MESDTLQWRIGYAGSSEGPYRLSEVFERLKERRWSGDVLVHARGRTNGWIPIEEVEEFAPLLAELRKTYLGPGGDLQWRQSDDRHERGVGPDVWTEPQSQVSIPSHPGDTWIKGGIDVREDSFGFLSPQTPPAPHRPVEPPQAPMLGSIPLAPRPSLNLPPPAHASSKTPQRIVADGAQLPGFRAEFQVPVPGSNPAHQASVAPIRYEQTIPGPVEPRSPATRIVTGPPSRHSSNSGIEVEEDGMSAFFAPVHTRTHPPAAIPVRNASPSPMPYPAAQARPFAPPRPTTPAPVAVEAPAPTAIDPRELTTRIIEAPPSMPGIVVTEDHFDAFLR